jgi:hypothetical protein
MRTLSEIYEEKKSFPFQVKCVANKAEHPLKLLIVGKRENGKFDSLGSLQSKSAKAGWSPDKRLWISL